MITHLTVRVLILLGLVSQTIASEVCACQPSRYKITLDLGLSCENSTVLNGDPGIYDVACTITDTKTTPVGVTSVIISEIDQSLNAFGKIQYDGPLTTSDNIRYNSTIASSKGDSTVIPRGLQVEIHAYDLSNASIVNKWVILYNNDCSETPVLAIGQRVGWTVFSNLIDPPVATCPVSKTTSEQVIRTETTSLAPVATIVEYPTMSPIETTFENPVTLLEDTSTEARSEVSHETLSSKKSGKSKKSLKKKKSPKSKKSKSSKYESSVDVEGSYDGLDEDYSGSYKVTNSKSKSKKSPKKEKSKKSKYSSKYSTKAKKSKKVPPSNKSKKSPPSKKSKSSKAGKGKGEPGEYYDLINSTKDGAVIDTSVTRRLMEEDTASSYKEPAPVGSSKSKKSKKSKSSKYRKGKSKKSLKKKKSPKSKKSKSSKYESSVDVEGSYDGLDEDYSGSYKVTNSKSKSKKSPKKEKSKKSKYSSKYSTKAKKSKKVPPSNKSKKSPPSKKSKSSKAGKGKGEPGEYYDLINSTKDGAVIDTSVTRRLMEEDTASSYKEPAPVGSSKSKKSKKSKSSKYGKGKSKKSLKKKKSPKSKKSKSSKYESSVDVEGSYDGLDEDYSGSYKVTNSKSKLKKSPKKEKSKKSKYSSKNSTKAKESKKVPPSNKSKKSPPGKKSKSSKAGKGHGEPGEYYDLINSTKDGTVIDTSVTRRLMEEDTASSYKEPAPVGSSKSQKSKKSKSSKYGKSKSKKSKKSSKSKKSKSSKYESSVDVEGSYDGLDEDYSGSYKVTSSKSKSKKSLKKEKSSKSKYSSKYSPKSSKSPKKKSSKYDIEGSMDEPENVYSSSKSKGSKKKSPKKGKGGVLKKIFGKGSQVVDGPGEYYDLINSSKE